MAVLDNLVAEAQRLSASDADLTQMLKSLKQSEPAIKQQANHHHGAALLAASSRLNAAQHSLASIYLL